MPHRRDLLKLAGVNALVEALGAVPIQAKLPSTVMYGSEAKVTKAAFGDERIYFDGPTDQLHSMTAGSLKLNPAMSPHAAHQHPEEELMVIAEGTGEISIDGNAARVGPGSMMYCAAGRMHAIVNTGATPLLFYFYKWKV